MNKPSIPNHEPYEIDGRRYLVAPRQTPTPRRAYRVKEVSEMLGVPKSTLYDLIRQKVIHAVLLGVGRRKILLIPAQEINRLLSARSIIDSDLLEKIRRLTSTSPVAW